ncbi:MAG TPA: hypothetical protein VM261_28010, partial [Kofleriaceae bacterium]|nr:hypothetical protein [Kofleriaceae bacterium]
MEPETSASAPTERGLVAAAPSGLVVRTHRKTVGDGPFRAIATVRVSAEPRARPNILVGVVRAVAVVGAFGMLAAALVAAAPAIARLMWAGQSVFLSL